MKNFSRFLAIFATVLILDILTKSWAEQALERYQPVPVIGELFRFTLGYNSGIAFGVFDKGGGGLLVVIGLTIVALIIWAIYALRANDFAPSAVWPMGVILGGAVANFVDRLPDMRVTDFLDVGIGATRWPTFNLADSFIFLGMALLLLTNFLAKSPQKDAQ